MYHYACIVVPPQDSPKVMELKQNVQQFVHQQRQQERDSNRQQGIERILPVQEEVWVYHQLIVIIWVYKTTKSTQKYLHKIDLSSWVILSTLCFGGESSSQK